MKTIPYVLLGWSLCLLPAHAASIQNATTRVETVGPPAATSVRLSVLDGGRWRPVLVSDRFAAGARFNTLAVASPPASGARLSRLATDSPSGGKALEVSGGTPGARLRTRLALDERSGHVHVVSTLTLAKATPVEALDTAWYFAPDGKPGRLDFTWTPNLTPNPDEVVGQHVFRSPGIAVQQGGVSAVLLPDLDVLDANWKSLPGTLNLDVRAPAGPRLLYSLQQHDVVRHVYWRHAPGEVKTLGPGSVTLAYDILLSAKTPPRMAYRQVARWWWEHEGERNLKDTLPQAVPWTTYASTGFDLYALPIAWREKTMGGETVGAVSMDTWGLRNATWFQCWFNDLRSAYGMYLWGKRLNRPDLVAKARQTRQLLLHSPQKDGLFPVIYDWDKGAWQHFPAGGGPDICHVVDCAWAAYWLLMWDQDLEKSPESVAFAKRLGDYFVGAQLPNGEIPAYIRMGTMQPTDHLVHGAETAGDGMFLAFLGRITGDARYLDAARKAAGYIRRDVWPSNRWYDYETFYSCSGKPETFTDTITGQNPQNNLSIQWSAEMFRQLYLAGKDPKDLADGEAMLDYLNLYQQVWSPSYLTFSGFGGYGVQNTDAEWNDARQAQFACTNLDFYTLTGKPEYFERAIAAMRAGFATTYMPENAFVSPNTYAKQPTGYADENYGHGGGDGPAGPTSWDWGTGSALASVAYAYRKYGDVWVDGDHRRAFGIDGVTASWDGKNLALQTSIQQVAPVTVRGAGKSLPETVSVNGTPETVSEQAWRDGFPATPVAAPRVRHRAPAILTADNATISFDVWPHSSASSFTVTASTTAGPESFTVPASQHTFTFPSRLFTQARQPLSYTIGAKDAQGITNYAYQTEVVRFGEETPLWTDDFAGTTLGNAWTVEIPTAGPTVAPSNGALVISVPAGQAFDQWIPANNGPRTMRAAPAGDWSYTVTLGTAGLPAAGNYQAALTVEMGPNDFAFFGPFQGRSITLERSGRNGLYSAPFSPASSSSVELRVRKSGGALWFDWRRSGDAWSAPASLPFTSAPARVGMLAKTWDPVAVQARFTEARMATLK